MAVSGEAVSVNPWSAWAVSALSSKAGHSSLSVKKLGDNYGKSG